MAFFIETTEKTKIVKKSYWDGIHNPGDTVEYSGIYKCTQCACEITSNEGDPFPPQNSHDHTGGQWKLNVQTNTRGQTF